MIFIIEEMYLVHREFQLTTTSIILQVNMEFLMNIVFNLYYFLFERWVMLSDHQSEFLGI